MSKRIIALFGAGYVTTTVVEYLTRRPENHLIIANRTLDHAIQKAKLFAHNPDQVECVAIDVADPSEKNVKAMESLIEKCDVAISLVPYTYHVILAKICIAKKKHLVTTSYISAAMRELDQAAKDAGVILMNEIGVDPGIDHIAAVKIISEVHAKGGKIISFTSWCGGLPALDAIGDNPLKYKFSWSPRGVLMATSNTAKYLWDGAVTTIEPQNLMISAFSLNLHPDFEFDGYPNRDSTPYVQEYHIPEAKTVLRGTLRYKGFCKMMFYLRKLGMMDATERADLKAGAAALKWKDLFAAQLGAKSAGEEDLTNAMLAKVELAADSDEGKRLVSTTKWFGLYGDETVSQKGSLLDAFSDLLQSKMVYGKGERDMIFLQHAFEIEWADGTKQKRTATLLCYGDGKEHGFSSMAKTTGLPCAISTQLILDKIITRTGVFGPMFPDMNEHIEKALEKEGIVVEDKIIA